MEHTFWRACKEWDSIGLHLSTTSDESCKLFDASLTQYVGWYNDLSLGGLENCLQKLMIADPNFVMGQVLINGIELIGTGHTTSLDMKFKDSINQMVALADKVMLTKREKQHVQALQLFSEGQMPSACSVWEDILISYPTDMLAIKLVNDSYFYLGFQEEMKNSLARVIPYWTKSLPLYGYLKGMQGFALAENKLYEEAETVAREGLKINRQDAWSTHALCHVFEMKARQKDGAEFLRSTENDWTKCEYLACHNYWHWALFFYEQRDFSSAIGVYDYQMQNRVKSGAILDIVDASSLLYRLELEGVNVGDRWNDLFEICRPHIDDHILTFNDAHFLMTFLGKKSEETVYKMMNSLKEYISSHDNYNQSIFKNVGIPLCEAFLSYEHGEFSQCVELLNEIHLDVIKIGGSDPQRDVFTLLLLHAALKSPLKQHHHLARELIQNRIKLKQDTPLTEKLMKRALMLHLD